MTAEQKVKQKYPNAEAVWTDREFVFIGSVAKGVAISEIFFAAHFPEGEDVAWESALARMEATHE